MGDATRRSYPVSHVRPPRRASHPSAGKDPRKRGVPQVRFRFGVRSRRSCLPHGLVVHRRELVRSLARHRSLDLWPICRDRTGVVEHVFAGLARFRRTDFAVVRHRCRIIDFDGRVVSALAADGHATGVRSLSCLRDVGCPRSRASRRHAPGIGVVDPCRVAVDDALAASSGRQNGCANVAGAKMDGSDERAERPDGSVQT